MLIIIWLNYPQCMTKKTGKFDMHIHNRAVEKFDKMTRTIYKKKFGNGYLGGEPFIHKH